MPDEDDLETLHEQNLCNDDCPFCEEEMLEEMDDDDEDEED